MPIPISVVLLCIAFLLMPVVAGANDEPVAPAQIALDQVTLAITFAPGEVSLSRQVILDWIGTAARAVADFYGRFPVARANIIITPTAGKGAHSGVAYAGEEPLITMSLGHDTDQRDLAEDWRMTHEMVHLAFPNQASPHLWLEEGIATYVEPLARLARGTYTRAALWRHWIASMPHGLPGPGDRGLDHTPTWGRIYWGGTLFCLLADIDIRQRTANRFGLRQALQGILAAGGNITTDWPIEKTLAAGDNAVGVSVLLERYRRMKDRPVAVDLDELWRRLGVRVNGEAVHFDEQAELAWVRRGIEVGGAEPPGRSK